tara:strand:+ start:358 stop:1707 length:1350 start_codon:yes stop_codon:yes gene_type:complete
MRRNRAARAILESDLGARFGFDIGGSLAKFCFLEKDEESSGSDRVLEFINASNTYGETGVREEALAVHLSALRGKMHFIRFASEHTVAAVDMLERQNVCAGIGKMYATGGGAHKYLELFKRRLGFELLPCNELSAVVQGICFMTKVVPDECYTYERVEDPSVRRSDSDSPSPSPRSPGLHAVGSSCDSPKRPPRAGPSEMGSIRKIERQYSRKGHDFFPFLLCNVGTGVSILHVESPTKYTRVSGTALGGGTFLGLCRMLTEARGFEEALGCAATGDSRKVDMLVQDIYGGGNAERSNLKLPGDLTASFFAKNIHGDSEKVDACDDDICKALLVMIAQNVSQIAHLNARLYGLERVFFTGNFLRENEVALRTIVYTMQRWSQLDGKQPTEACFFRHEGYFGAVGAFLNTLDDHVMAQEVAAPATATAAPSSTRRQCHAETQVDQTLPNT